MKQHSLPIILFGDSIIPRCVPFYYRLFLLWCKLYRSTKKRLLPARREEEVIPDEDFTEGDRRVTLGENKDPFINKTFFDMEIDLKRAPVQDAVRRIRSLKERLKEKWLKYTTAAGSFKHKDHIPEKELNKLWENAWVLANSGVKKGDTVLDIGGASTIFSYLLADMGCKVHVVDNDWGNHGIVYNARYVKNKMGWDMSLYRRDITKKLPFGDKTFDKVFCICVLEHLPSSVRRKVMQEINRVLKPGGIAGITIDYDKRRDTLGFDRGIRYVFKKRLVKDIIEPSGLSIYGNTQLIDNCPSDFFLGALFLVK